MDKHEYISTIFYHLLHEQILLSTNFQDFVFLIYDTFIASTTSGVYKGCSLTIGTRGRHCPFGVQPVFVWYLTSIVGYYNLLFSINVLGYFSCLGVTLPIHGTNSFYVVSEPQPSNVESQVFTPYKFYCTGRGSNHQPLHSRPACYRSATQLITFLVHLKFYL